MALLIAGIGADRFIRGSRESGGGGELSEMIRILSGEVLRVIEICREGKIGVVISYHHFAPFPRWESHHCTFLSIILTGKSVRKR